MTPPPDPRPSSEPPVVERHDALPEWWQHAVVYQIYPRSFADSPGGPVPGVGDLAGITSRLDHLAWLGVDALWLSPVFRSPMADFGYDVSDYCDIDPTFGTLDDLDRLVAEAHARGIRVMLDWVPNHTSDRHPWFEESRRDRTNPKAGWYVWRDEPATNWVASFTRETVWQHDPQRDQYYLHCFLPEQPDLDWDHPEVEAAMHDTLRFWLDRGIDGFRMDVIHLIGKDLSADDPADAVERGISHVIFNDVPVTLDRLRRIRAVLDEYPGERTSVGEVYLLDEERMASYLGTADDPLLHMSFNFRFLWAPFETGELRGRLERTLAVLGARGATPTWVLSNHDVPRHRQRYGGDELHARMAALMLLTLPGTAFLYQGEELGLVDAIVPPERVVDPGGRDGCRAPIPWEPADGHGWQADPWLPFPPEADRRNVATQLAEPDSILHWYRRVMLTRRAEAGLRSGETVLVDVGDDSVLAYRRGDLLVALHLGDSEVELPEPVVPVVATDPTVEGTVLRRMAPLTAWVARRA